MNGLIIAIIFGVLIIVAAIIGSAYAPVDSFGDEPKDIDDLLVDGSQD